MNILGSTKLHQKINQDKYNNALRRYKESKRTHQENAWEGLLEELKKPSAGNEKKDCLFPPLTSCFPLNIPHTIVEHEPESTGTSLEIVFVSISLPVIHIVHSDNFLEFAEAF